jgi:hypothetical protein
MVKVSKINKDLRKILIDASYRPYIIENKEFFRDGV